MSTRSNIIIKDNSCKVYLYRHSDGYPEGAGVDLKKFLEKHEYDKWSGSQLATDLIRFHEPTDYGFKVEDYYPYELTNGIHGDIEYLYVINLIDNTLKCYDVTGFDNPEEDIIKSENLIDIP